MQTVHEQQRTHECPKCLLTFVRKDHLIRHMESKHAENRQVLQCPYLEEGCLMSFPNRDQLNKHLKRTHEKKKIPCLQCEELGQRTEFAKKN